MSVSQVAAANMVPANWAPKPERDILAHLDSKKPHVRTQQDKFPGDTEATGRLLTATPPPQISRVES